MSEAKENLRWFNKVRRLDEQYIKKQTHGARLSSIDSMARIAKATEVWGPCGIGWGYETQEPFWKTVGNTECVFVRVRAWFKDDNGEIGFTGYHTGGTKVTSQNIDEAIKCSETDGLGKALSHLGLAADIYLGMFDGDKYKYPAEYFQEDEPAPVAKAKPSGNGKPKAEKSSKSELQETAEIIVENDPGAWVIDFGKHKGKTLAALFDENPNYFKWFLNQNKDNPPEDEMGKFRLAVISGFVAEEYPDFFERIMGDGGKNGFLEKAPW